MKFDQPTRSLFKSSHLKTAIVAMLSLLIAEEPVNATSMLYVGTQKIGTIFASYSITTDGTFGAINASNVSAFDITLSDSKTNIEFGKTATLSNGMLYGRLSASPQQLAVYPDISPFLFSTTQKDYFGNYVASLTLYETFSEATFSDAAHNGSFDQHAQKYNVLAFANVSYPATSGPVAPVPEPATWTMMVVGMGAAGGVLRRRQKTALRLPQAV